MENDRQAQISELVDTTYDEVWKGEFATFSGMAYHYTNAKGAKGIITNSEIWLSDVQQMSDRSELVYSMQRVDKILEEFYSKSTDGLERNFLQPFHNGIFDSFHVFRYFAGCFSKSSDKLSQWRAYADDGSGYSIGVTIPEPGSEPHPDMRRNVLIVTMNYGEEDLIKRQTRYVEHALHVLHNERIKRLIKGPDDARHLLKVLATALGGHMITEALIHKHPGFEEEEEVRIILFAERTKLQPDVKLRESSGRLIPYIPYPIEGGVEISTIVIGPAAHEDENVSAADLVSKAGLDAIPIGRSDIPYRTGPGRQRSYWQSPVIS